MVPTSSSDATKKNHDRLVIHNAFLTFSLSVRDVMFIFKFFSKVHVPPLNHIGLWIDDLEKAVEWMQSKGVRFTPVSNYYA